MSQLPQIKIKGTLSERTYQILKKAIIETDLAAGQLITEEEVAEQLGVSRTPLRTAFSRLAFEGLLDIIPGKGTFVSNLTTKQCQDLFAVRLSLESLSFNLAAENRTKEDLKYLKSILDRQSQMLPVQENNKNELISFLKFDVEFHTAIGHISKNDYLDKQITQLMSHFSRYLFAATDASILMTTSDEHMVLYELVKNGENKDISLHIQKHIAGIEERILSVLRQKQ